MHPMERRYLRRRMSRRDFLRGSAAAAIGVPSLSALLAACTNPRNQQVNTFQVATPNNPVTLPMVGEAIADDLPNEKNATLQIFNWDAYTWKKVIEEFCEQHDCDYEYTPFHNMETAVSKIQTGQLKFDVFFPTYDVLGKLVHGGYLQPLNHSYIPNLESQVWDQFQNPFYDQGWRYSVPYTVYTTGIAYRRETISDDQIFGASNPRALLWDPQYSGKVGVYDSYRDTIAFAIEKLGSNDINTEDPKLIDQAKQQLLDMIDAVNVRATINGAYAKLPKGDYVLHEAWSGDIVAGWGYVSKYTEAEFKDLGYWFPDDRMGPADNDLIAIPSSAEHPVLAHKFLNFFLDFKHAMDNFSWVGYQPPQKQADVDRLTKEEGLYSKISNWAPPVPYVPPWMPAAVVRQSDLFQTGLRLHELSPQGDQLWQDAWQEFIAGA